jgi:hypothetical protein
MALFAGPVFSEMTEYRAFIVGDDGHVIGYRAFKSADDSDAIVWAKQLVDGHDVELWSAGRLVVRLHQAKK